MARSRCVFPLKETKKRACAPAQKLSFPRPKLLIYNTYVFGIYARGFVYYRKDLSRLICLQALRLNYNACRIVGDDSHAILKAIPVSQPTGEDTTVIQTYSESGYIADEYIFIDEKCVFCNDEDIADGITMGALVREYVEDVFFGKK